MGCDIHMYVEVRESDGWRRLKADETTYQNLWNYGFGDGWWDGRNYDLFAMLADVRNGYGFAGRRTGGGFVPISEPKGFPEDVSEDLQAISDDWDCDGHSHNWITIEEWLNYDLNQTTTHVVEVRDTVSEGTDNIAKAQVYADKGQNIPDYLIAGGFLLSSQAEINVKQFENRKHYYESVPQSFFAMMNALYIYAKNRGLTTEDVRLVYLFDN